MGELCVPQGVGAGAWVPHLQSLMPPAFVANLLVSENVVKENKTLSLRSEKALTHKYLHLHPHTYPTLTLTPIPPSPSHTHHTHISNVHSNLSFVLLYDLHMSWVRAPIVVGQANSNGNGICFLNLHK